jgi:hypothetical protein
MADANTYIQPYKDSDMAKLTQSANKEAKYGSASKIFYLLTLPDTDWEENFIE